MKEQEFEFHYQERVEVLVLGWRMVFIGSIVNTFRTNH